MMSKSTKPPRGKRGQPAAASVAVSAADADAPAKGRKARKPDIHYTAELGQRICDQVAEGATMEKICVAPDMPSSRAVRNWERQHQEFAQALEEAKEHRAEVIFEEIATLGEDVRNGKVGHAEGRLLFDVLKYRAGRDSPRRYGDKPVAVDVKVGLGVQSENADSARWLEGVLASADRTNVVPLSLLPPKTEAGE